ncbi:MAG: hypothetical protein WCO98_15145 [bacterium]
MSPKYLLIFMLLIIGLFAMADDDQPESQLANIKVGLKRDKLVGILGPPSGFYMAQPTINFGLPNETNPDSKKTPYNSVIFVMNADGSFFKNVEKVFSPSGDPETDNARSYWWNEVVRPSRLTLDQRILVYWINDTYVMAFTFKGDGPDAPLSDITACSFEPFLTPIGPGAENYRRKALNFMYRYKTISKDMKPTTYKGISIGDKMDAVLIKYGWPEYYYPFIPEQLPPIRIKNGKYEIDDMQAVINAAINTGQQPNEMPGGPTGGGNAPAPAPTAPGLNNNGGGATTGGGAASDTEKYKPPQAIFAWMLPFDYPETFTKSCFMIYPKQRIAFTIVNMTVTRIQMGLGVVAPPTPDIPRLYWPFMSGAASAGGGATTATPPPVAPNPGPAPNIPRFGGPAPD